MTYVPIRLTMPQSVEHSEMITGPRKVKRQERTWDNNKYRVERFQTLVDNSFVEGHVQKVTAVFV